MSDNILKFFPKDSEEVLDYVFDWTRWLSVGETISSYTLTPSSGLTVSTSHNDSLKITAWITGGDSKLETLRCHIVTTEGREAIRTAGFNIAPR